MSTLDQQKLNHYERLHDGLSDMIERGRLSEEHIPDDYQWLVEMLVSVPQELPTEQPELERDPASPEEIERAREEYGSDEIEIDDNALRSDAMPEGVWVQGWLWLRNEDEEEEV